MKIPPTYPCGKRTIRSRFGLGGDSANIIGANIAEIKPGIETRRDSNPRLPRASRWEFENRRLRGVISRAEISFKISVTPRKRFDLKPVLRPRAGTFFSKSEHRTSVAPSFLQNSRRQNLPRELDEQRTGASRLMAFGAFAVPKAMSFADKTRVKPNGVLVLFP